MNKSILGVVSAIGLLAIPVGAQTTQQSAGASTQSEDLSNPYSVFRGDGRRASWHAEVVRTERGYKIGNPRAEASLIEFISYTCGHCATFAREGERALDLALLAPGHMTVEVRPVIRNAIDLTVSLLVQCGDADGFKNRHRMYLLRQEDWLQKVVSAPQSQRSLWARGDRASRVNAAVALDLDDMLAETGTSRSDINRCLNDDAAATALIDNSDADREEFAVPGTPSFALDGELLKGVHSWASLYPVLSERFRPGSER